VFFGNSEHLALHHVRKAVDAADAVGHRHHRALRAHVRAGVEVLDAALDESEISEGLSCMKAP
jgi:hypothetical protein